MAILAINAGSSSLKFSLHDVTRAGASSRLLSGSAEGLEPGGTPRASWSHAGIRKQVSLEVTGGQPFAAALEHLAQRLRVADPPAITAIAHRVVHGGRFYRKAVRVNKDVLNNLRGLAVLAPLHQPHNIAGIEAFTARYPDLPQVACFDTAFHATLAEPAYSFALPRALAEQGIRRYGFHGLSYQFIMSRLEQHSRRAHDRVVMAHLGNGASLCAASAGRSCATTMGFTALDGLMMGTRSGSIDAGILLHLMGQGWNAKRLQDLLYLESGLLGVSGLSADMRYLRENGSERALQAIEQFTYRVVRETGAMTACLGGIDLMAFSGGIGEHDATLRADVCRRLAYLGLSIDESLNLAATGGEARAIHAKGSAAEIWVIPTDEGSIAAEETAALLSAT